MLSYGTGLSRQCSYLVSELYYLILQSSGYQATDITTGLFCHGSFLLLHHCKKTKKVNLKLFQLNSNGTNKHCRKH